MGLPITVAEYQPPYRRGPRLGEDTAPLLARLGFSSEQVAELARAGAFGPRGGAGGATPEGASI